MPEVNSSKCKARQYSDSMQCVCGLAWDVNDPDPPACRGARTHDELASPGCDTGKSASLIVATVDVANDRFDIPLPEGITRLLAPRPPSSASFAKTLIRLQNAAERGRGAERGVVGVYRRDLQDLLRDWQRLDDIVRSGESDQ